MKIAMHQANFFPWYPYFHRMRRVDKFVIVSQCQFANYLFQKRFHLNGNWYSMPINNRKTLEPILNKKYINPEKNWAILKRRLPEYTDILSFFDRDISESLVDTNIRIIKRIRVIFGIETELVYDYPTQLTSTDRVVDLMKTYGEKGSTFVAGPSLENYADTSLFETAGFRIAPHTLPEDLKIPVLPMLKRVLG